MVNLKNYVSEFIDFPKKGIVFKDLNQIYRDPFIWKQALLPLENLVKKAKPNLIVGIESRGFIIGAAIAYRNEIGFLPVRKSNKLPGKVIGLDYQLEYSTDRLELQLELIKKDNNRILIIDDVLATGGTASTVEKLINQTLGDVIGYGFLVEISFLNGRKLLNNELLIESSIIY